MRTSASAAADRRTRPATESENKVGKMESGEMNEEPTIRPHGERVQLSVVL